MTRRPTPFEVAVDCAAVARLTRLGVQDTWPPVRWARERILARWPAPGDPVPQEAQERMRLGRVVADERGHPIEDPHAYYAEHPHAGWLEVIDIDAPHRWGWARGTYIGEWITCPWCFSAAAAVVVVLARRFVPGPWDVAARVLAGSLTAGLVAELTA